MTDRLTVLYWDSTALLAYLFKDRYSENVKERSRQKGAHLLTSLALAEVYTVISRVQRENLVPDEVIDRLYEIVENGPWQKLNIFPDSSELRRLASRWPLKNSRLWHLATAKTLQQEFPELMLLTLDRELAKASESEKLKVCL